MINTRNGVRTIHCDFCSEEAESETPGNAFMEDLDEWKEDGWRAFKEGDTWQHKCPTCSDSSA